MFHNMDKNIIMLYSLSEHMNLHFHFPARMETVPQRVELFVGPKTVTATQLLVGENRGAVPKQSSSRHLSYQTRQFYKYLPRRKK